MTLVLAEKPSVARDIARVLGAATPGKGCLTGGGYVVTWALGHLVTQCEPEEIEPAWKKWSRQTLPILPARIPLKVPPACREQFARVKALLNDPKVERVVCATDAGREGELIFRRIYQAAGCNKPVERLWISSMTAEAIREGFARLAPAREYDALYQSAQCRSDADWLVGMNGSRAFTLRYNTLLSVGRVQTPTLSLLAARRKEIEAFTPQPYWEVEADFGGYKGTWTDETGNTRFPEEAQARHVAEAVRGKQARVEAVRTQRKSTPPPLLYDLTTLQREANARFGLTAAATLAAAQSLYEKHKALTYPRTDSRYLTRDMRDKVEQTLRALPEPYRDLVLPPEQARDPGKRLYDDSRVSDHTAILPTGKAPGKMSGAEAQVYNLVARRLVAAFYPDLLQDLTKVETRCGEHLFLTKGTVTVQPGWRRVLPPPREEETPLPPLTAGMTRRVEAAQVLAKTTRPPAHYTENTLLEAMEHAGRLVADERLREQLKEKGLGTPATRAAILERLIQVGYVRRDKRSLIATDKGLRLIEVAPAPLASPETTGRWEKGLTDIAKGKMDPERFMGSIRRYCAYLVESADASPAAVFPKEPPRGKAAPGAAGKRGGGGRRAGGAGGGSAGPGGGKRAGGTGGGSAGPGGGKRGGGTGGKRPGEPCAK